MQPIRQYLEDLKAKKVAPEELQKHCFKGLDAAQKKALALADVKVYTGKIRDMVFGGDQVQVLHSDRLTAFDRLIGHVPYKGTILTAISEYWFAQAANVVPTHYKSRPGERVLSVLKCEPVKAEVVVRGYLAGSMLRAYQSGDRLFCGVTLPDGLKPFAKLPQPIITPTTKAAAFDHDEETTAAELIARRIATEDEWQTISAMALKLFAHGTEVLATHDWILVDTKYEFGRGPGRSIAVIDEMHSPDSSRFWRQDTYEANLQAGRPPDMLDKEIVRRWLLERNFKGHGDVPEVPADILINLGLVYLDVAEKLIGKPILTAGPNQTITL